MVAIKVEKKRAEQVKRFLLSQKFFDNDYIPQTWGDFVLFPIVKGKDVVIKKKYPFVEAVQFVLRKGVKKLPAADLLKSKLTKKELSLLPKAYEQVGDIVILELPPELYKKDKIIACAFLECVPSARTVVRKSAIHSGIYRTRKVRILAGEKKKETVHTESGVRVNVNIEKMYFSSRLVSERLRIARQIRKKEEALVMFSGCGIYPIVFAKNSPVRKVTGIEINPIAHQYALQNVKQNNVEKKVTILEGDVWDIVPKLRGKFDRIAMPLPKTGELFLPLALKKIKKNGIIHLYAFINDNDFEDERKKIKDILKTSKKKYRIIRVVKCGQNAPFVYRYCFDIKVY